MGTDSSNKDYRGKDLRGRSFKGQNLAGADFSDAQLGGVDFSEADLTGAKFCRAVMGHSKKGKSVLLVYHLGIGGIAGLLAMIGAIFGVLLIQSLLRALHFSETEHIFEITTGIAFVISFGIWLAVQRQRLDYILWLMLFLVAVAVAVAVAGAGAGAVAVAVAGEGAIFLFLGMYLGRRAVLREEAHLSLIRRWNLLVSGFGATQFSGKISNADFSGANLQHVRFINVSFINCIWQDASKLHLALTRGTLLATRKVRQLLTTGKNDDHDFTGMDLAGIEFAGMDLRNYNFTNANLSNANFSGADLRDAILTAANVTSARFCHAKLTGAIIENWNIDPHTAFDEQITCDYVFLGSKKDDCTERERNPPTGNFKPGEFAKLYQQVANTIDFILHSRDELDAINRSIAHLKANGADIEVESVERKNDAVVVRLKAPPGFDREQVYAEVKQEFTLQLALAEKDVQSLTRERDTLSTLLIGMTQNPAKIIVENHNHNNNNNNNQQEHNVNDNRRTQIVKDNTFSQSPVSFGDHATITQTIAALPESQTELKSLLTQLTTLIEQSHASAADKQDALHQTATIIEAAQQTDTPQPGRITRALNFITSVFSGIENANATVEQMNTVISKISDLMG